MAKRLFFEVVLKAMVSLRNVRFQLLRLAIKFGLVKTKWADVITFIVAPISEANMRVKKIPPCYNMLCLFHNGIERVTPLAETAADEQTNPTAFTLIFICKISIQDICKLIFISARSLKFQGVALVFLCNIQN